MLSPSLSTMRRVCILFTLIATPLLAATLKQPNLPIDAVVCPVFHDTQRPNHGSGTAFVARMDNNRPLLITALHLLAMPAREAPDRIKSVDLLLPDRSAPIGTAGPALLHTGFVSTKDVTGDCAIFDTPHTQHGGVLSLAKADPRVDDGLWIVGKSDHAREPTYLRATVIGARPTMIMVRLEKLTNMTGFSGSPAVNASGEVVGLTLDAGTYQGTTIVALMPVTALRHRVADALAGK